MNKIAFSHLYTKLTPFADALLKVDNVTLIGVFQVLSCELEDCFWEYDADGKENVERFGYTRNGEKKLLLLIFRRDNRIFTTVRPHRWQTYDYYRMKVGEEFKVVIT
jgi:hypothetical protein